MAYTCLVASEKSNNSMRYAELDDVPEPVPKRVESIEQLDNTKAGINRCRKGHRKKMLHKAPPKKGSR